jgi:5-methylcytosine-specific restriction endonuclease McrA
MSPYRICIERRCSNRARPGRPRCEQHDKELERERSARRRADAAQGRRIQVYHSKRWLITREAVLTRNPICADCGERLAEHVDHIIPLAQGGPEFALSNLQGLCRVCHRIKSAQEQRGRGRS